MIFTRLARDNKKIVKVLGLVSPLFDTRRENLTPREYWQDGTYFTHPARAKAVLVNLEPGRRLDREAMVSLGRQGAGLLEARTGLVTDWCGGISKDGRRVVLVFKTLAHDNRTWRRRELWVEPEDLRAMAELVPRRGKDRDRWQHRRRGMERGR
ncbi:hypothetical protein [Desulforamulus ruminis]|uniref:Uncharacterized protein n=1 Tax=Desulforamulus ruminis (strain ATCC 23193 / DSM 2154 / NCIMB 8452 / DL) TaxID=696281 RepID=F6DTV6_DESRL|nr:hypothetical protein [Desulforamulus ruminis]AEG58974.1 hypothetical protein Desru_0689 [Desulforamulus ruminis DSM 2154]